MEEERGQPLKLAKPRVRENLLTAIGKGASYQIACGYAGISYQTLRRWVIRGEALLNLSEEEIAEHEDKIYYDLYCDLKRVESYAALKWLEKIDKAADVHWQAAAWKLERRHPDDYGRVDKESKSEADDTLLNKAREEVEKLKGDANGQSPSATG